MVHIYDQQTMGHILTSERMPIPQISGATMEIKLTLDGHTVAYEYYINEIVLGLRDEYAMVYVTLQKVTTDGIAVPIS